MAAAAPPAAAARPPLLVIDAHVIAEILTHFDLPQVARLRSTCRLLCRLAGLGCVMKEVLFNEVGRSREALCAAFWEFGVTRALLFSDPPPPPGAPDPRAQQRRRRLTGALPPAAGAGGGAGDAAPAAPSPRAQEQPWAQWVSLIRRHAWDCARAPPARGVGCSPYGVVQQERPNAELTGAMGIHAFELPGGKALLLGGGTYDRYDNLTQHYQAAVCDVDGNLRAVTCNRGAKEAGARAVYGCGACRVSRSEVLLFGGGTYTNSCNDLTSIRIVESEEGVSAVEWRVLYQDPAPHTHADIFMDGNAAATPGGGPPTPCRRFGSTMVYHNGRCILFGGRRGNYHFNDIWTLDLETLRWREQECSGEVPSPRLWAQALVVGDSMLLFGGGAWFAIQWPSEESRPEWPRDRRYVYRLCLRTWRWDILGGRRAARTGPPPLMQFGMSRVGRHVIVTGGFTTERRYYHDLIWSFDLASAQWRLCGRIDRARASHVQVTHAEGVSDQGDVPWRLALYGGGRYMYRDMYPTTALIRVHGDLTPKGFFPGMHVTAHSLRVATHLNGAEGRVHVADSVGGDRVAVVFLKDPHKVVGVKPGNLRVERIPPNEVFDLGNDPGQAGLGHRVHISESDSDETDEDASDEDDDDKDGDG